MIKGNIIGSTKLRLRTFLHYSSEVVQESAQTNLRRTYYLAIIAASVRILDIFIFAKSNTILDSWSRGIIISHITLLVLWLIVFSLAHGLKKLDRNSVLILYFQYMVIAVVMIPGIIITAIDQLVTSNITPFILVCIVTGTIFLIKPLVSALIFLISYLIYYHVIAITIVNDNILLTNRVNGITIVCFGFVISVMFWHYNSTNIIQKHHIEAQQKQLEQMAYYDPLTRIYNRHFFTEIIEKEFKMVSRYNHESAIIFLDIDNFKRINDNYGHLLGDQVLMEMGELLKANIRETDTLARFGGEEFIILAPQTSLVGSVELAEKLRELISKHPFLADDNRIHITASFGVALLEVFASRGIEYSLDQVDKALYKAKNNGKNRVEVI